MPVLSSNKKNEALYLTHSKYFYQCIGGLPFAPQVYWNVVTDDDVIPVVTHGYKNEKSVQRQIKSYISNIKEFRLIHVETEEEYHIEKIKSIQQIRRVFYEESV